LLRSRSRILIVEDEYFIATDLARLLRKEGYEIAGPAPSVEQALVLIREQAPTAAVLDIQLNEEQSYAVADHLASLDTPFLFLTSYTEHDLPERFRDRPLISKLSDFDAVVRALRKVR
jgi:two-component system, response regulator PdtaR